MKEIMKEKAKLFLESRGLSGKSLQLYQMVLKQFFEFIKKESFDQEDLLKFHVHLKETGVKPRTIATYLTILRTFFKFLDLPVEKVKIPRIPREFKFALNREQIDSILSLGINQEYKLAFGLMALCGLRISEVLGLKTEDIDLKQQTIKVRGKGAKERVVILPKVLIALIPQKSGKLFDFSARILQYKIKDLAKQAGIKEWQRITPHILRASFATIWDISGGPRGLLKFLMGHTPETTDLYIRPSLEEMKSWYQKIFESG